MMMMALQETENFSTEHHQQQQEEQDLPHTRPQQHQQQEDRLTSIPSDVYQLVGGYLNAWDLCQLDETCSAAKQQSFPVWERLATNVPTVSAAHSDLFTYNTTAKARATLFYRAVRFAQQMETLNAQHMMSSSPCEGCKGFPDTDQMVLLEPEAFLCFCRISVTGMDIDSSSSTTSVVWQGFVNPMEQGAWGDSTILFFPLKEKVEESNWSDAWKRLFAQPVHPQDAVNDNSTSDYQTALAQASSQIAVTIIAFRKEYPDLEPPSLVCATRGLDYISQDNKVYYHLTSRPGQQHVMSLSPGEEESFLYPRLVASVPTTSSPEQQQEATPSQLLGIRLLAKSAWE